MIQTILNCKNKRKKMNIIEIYNNTDNEHRQSMFYDYLIKKSDLKKSSCNQYANSHPNTPAIF